MIDLAAGGQRLSWPSVLGSRRGRAALGRRGGPRVGHQRHQAREPLRPRQAGLRRVHGPPGVAPDGAGDRGPRPGGGLRPRGRCADPLAPENLLKASGRGIFFMRSFMDDVQIRRGRRGRDGSPDGEALRPPTTLEARLTDPLFLATAVEAVIRAGDIQLAHFGGDLRHRQEGRDRPRHRGRRRRRADVPRAWSPSGFPTTRCVAEELGGDEAVRARHCWVFDPLDGTTNYAHGLPIFCSSLALEIDGRAEVAADLRSAPDGSCSPRSAAAARS